MTTISTQIVKDNKFTSLLWRIYDICWK